MTVQENEAGSTRIDALLPAEIARKAEQVGAQKVRIDAVTLIALAVLAGAFYRPRRDVRHDRSRRRRRGAECPSSFQPTTPLCIDKEVPCLVPE